MTATVENTDTGAYVLINGIGLEPSDARELARQLIECAHECDKRRRRLKHPGAILDAHDLASYLAEHDAR